MQCFQCYSNFQPLAIVFSVDWPPFKKIVAVFMCSFHFLYLPKTYYSFSNKKCCLNCVFLGSFQRVIWTYERCTYETVNFHIIHQLTSHIRAAKSVASSQVEAVDFMETADTATVMEAWTVELRYSAWSYFCSITRLACSKVYLYVLFLWTLM